MSRSRSNTLDLIQGLFPAELRDGLFESLLSGTRSSSSTDRSGSGSVSGSFMANIPSVRQTSYKLPLAIVKSDSKIVIYAEMPGFEKKNIDVEFYNNKINITGQKIPPEILPDAKVTSSTIKYGNFHETVNLPVSITDRQNVSVKYEHGLLQIVVDLSREELNRFRVNLNDDTTEETNPLFDSLDQIR